MYKESIEKKISWMSSHRATSDKKDSVIKFCNLSRLNMSLGPYAAELIETARAIAAPGKGILAADESTGTIGSRFKAINVENTEENRRKYRQLLFKAENIEEHVSGVIFYEETLYQSTDEGTQFVDLLKSKGIIPGIKVRVNAINPTLVYLIIFMFLYHFVG